MQLTSVSQTAKLVPMRVVRRGVNVGVNMQITVYRITQAIKSLPRFPLGVPRDELGDAGEALRRVIDEMTAQQEIYVDLPSVTPSIAEVRDALRSSNTFKGDPSALVGLLQEGDMIDLRT